MKNGFTLIQISIALVIIGLIVGGVLVGQDYVAASATRSTIARIDAYQAAATAFRKKYGYLPGDLPMSFAANAGFKPRGKFPGEGDGNGVIEGATADALGHNTGLFIVCGETGLFWSDLSKARMTEDSFTSAMPYYGAEPCAGIMPSAKNASFLPSAPLGKNNFIYVWSGGWLEINHYPFPGDNRNYFGLSAVTGLSPNVMGTDVSLTPSEAYAIDKKIDDGFPQRGNVLAMMPNLTSHSPWAAGGNSDPLFGMTVGGDCDPGSCGPVELGDGVATLPSDATCYDNAGKEGQRERYSVGWKDGSLTTCALSFRFQ